MRADGTGGSRAGTLALTPEGMGAGGREGLLIFVRDRQTGAFWQLGRPTIPTSFAGSPDDAATAMRVEPGVITLDHKQAGIETTLEVCVPPTCAVELRRVRIRNGSDVSRHLEITSLAEIALNEAAAHASHPGFSRLFVQTEFAPEQSAILARRRPRAPHENWPVLVHALPGAGRLEHETDRLRWRGRGRHIDRPLALADASPLSGTTGNVLDPVASLRRALTLGPGETATFLFLLGVADHRADALALAAAFADPEAVDSAFADARAEASADLGARGWSARDDAEARALAAAVVAGDSGLRAGTDVLARASGRPGDLAHLGVETTGALAVVHERTATPAAVARLMAMHRLWHALGLPIQLVRLGADGTERAADAGQPGVLYLAEKRLTDDQLDLLDAAAHLVVTRDVPAAETASLAMPTVVLPVPVSDPGSAAPTMPRAPEALQFFNGHGGFSADGREYVIRLSVDAEGRLQLPPLPWTNVMANDRLGCIISETGAGAVWCENSRENRLTPWSNDAVLDPHSDALYLRDDDTGVCFSCFPGPLPGGGPCEVRHGFGYTSCRRQWADLTVETTVFVARDEPVRFSRIRITDLGGRPRRLSLYLYSQLVLGGLPQHSSRQVTTGRDESTGALLARNRSTRAFAGHVAFATVVADTHMTAVHTCGDRLAFLGPDLDPSAPAALGADVMDGNVGAGLDPCFAVQGRLVLEAGGSAEVHFLLGQESGEDAARELIVALGQPGACEHAWHQAHAFWRDGLGGLQVATPSPALDLMLGGWLGYQTLACRMRGRSAFYQSGGAFGFRDQLQDSLSLLPYWPDLARRQILLHAGHQFVEGDVLHWWHPPLNTGIRTRFADDLLWLPYIACEYARQTGDVAVFEEIAPYLTAAALPEGEDEIFLQTADSGTSGTLYEHCCRALDRSLAVGTHGLPLFGTGDWNDGMNRVGREGRGQSVWMGFFLVSIFEAFIPVCDGRGDVARSERYQTHRAQLERALNDTGWDGQWYRRGYYDDGTPLGSHESTECRIDALAQSWSVLSKVAPPGRAAQAMDAVEKYLVSDDERLIRLLTPPFVDTPHDPGYIKGYVAGVRENGGQYTHAATWVVRAMAELGRRERAAALLDLINPVLQATTGEQAARYMVEPYVVAADVYGAAPHVGRGGWTWYTGSSGWFQRVALESVLGLRTDGGDTLVVAPCVPDAWPGYRIEWRVPGTPTVYEIRVENPDRCSAQVVSVTVDGRTIEPQQGTARLPLERDGRRHLVEITMGPRKDDS